MAKKTVAEMTPEELAARHEKAAERRAQRKDNNKVAIQELVDLLSDEQLDKLSEVTKKFIQLNLGEYVRTKISVAEGDTLQSLFMAHPNLSYKKLAKKCEAAGLKIDETGTIVKL